MTDQEDQWLSAEDDTPSPDIPLLLEVDGTIVRGAWIFQPSTFDQFGYFVDREGRRLAHVERWRVVSHPH